MAVSARLALNLSASQTPDSSQFSSGGVSYGLAGLDQSFSGVDVSQVYVAEIALAAGVETRLDLSDMGGANDGLQAAFAVGSLVGIVIQVAAGLVAAATQHVLVRGLGGLANELPVESDASRIGLLVWTSPGGLPLTTFPELRFESVKGTSSVSVWALTKSGTGSAVPARIRPLTLTLSGVALDAALAPTFLRIPAGHTFSVTGYAALTEDAALAVGGTAMTFAVGYSADGVALTTEWSDDLQPDGTARFALASPAPTGTTPAATHSIYLESKVTGTNAKTCTLLVYGYLLPD